MGKFVDLTGKTFGRWTVIKQADSTTRSDGKRRQVNWVCQCSCNKHTVKTLSSSELGRSKSCGCIREELFTNWVKNQDKQLNHYNLMGDYGIGYTKDNQEFFFDLEDYSIIKNYTWYVSNGYIVASVWNTQKKCSKRMTMHRLILETCLNKNIINDIDHKNRKRYDNRKENLRICTHKDNLKNSSIRSNNTSGLIGVVYDRNREKWMARIVLNKKDIYLGRYSNKEDAIKARLEAEIKYFGEFAPQRHLFEQYGVNINGSDIDIQSERWNEENSDEN